MYKKELYLLLELIKDNGDIKRLLRLGISFKQISDLTSEAINEKFIFYEHEEVRLTTSGLSYLENAKGNYKIINKEEWIDKDKKHKIKPIDKDDIFLPDRNNLSF